MITENTCHVHPAEFEKLFRKSSFEDFIRDCLLRMSCAKGGGGVQKNMIFYDEGGGGP